MRKVVWAAAIAYVATVALCIAYLATRAGRETTAPPVRPEGEQEFSTEAEPGFSVVRARPPLVIGGARPLQPGDSEGNVDACEPIVVEGAREEPSPIPQIGGEAIPGADVQEAIAPNRQPPRPDEQPGEPLHMSYASEKAAGTWLPVLLWEAVCRLFEGSACPKALNGQTVEPPVGVPAAPDMEPASVGPIIDYHYHERSCPCTGRCPIRYHAVPAAGSDGK